MLGQVNEIPVLGHSLYSHKLICLKAEDIGENNKILPAFEIYTAFNQISIISLLTHKTEKH